MVLLSTQQARTAQPRLAATNVLRRACACGQHTWGGECPACRQKKGPTLQRAAVRTDSAAAGAVPPIVHEVLQSPGQPLDPETRTFMEPRFGQDLSRVRVHANARAAESAWAVNARAYTVGNAIVFGAGFYAPQNPDGRRLLAHELSHVVQQRPGSSTPAGPIALGAADSSTEREADSLADRVTGHHHGPEREPTTHVRTETASRGVATLQRDFFSSSSSADGGADAGVDAGTVGGTDAGTDAGSAASCKVDVRATHIGGILSGLPIWHLFVVYTDTSGTEYFFRGGPGGSCSGVAAGTHGTVISTRGP